MAHIVHTTNRFGSRHLNERQSQTRLQSSWSTKSCRAVIVSCVSCCFRVKHPLTSYLHTHVEHDIKTQVLYMYIFPLCIKTFYFTPPNCFWPMMWHVFYMNQQKNQTNNAPRILSSLVRLSSCMFLTIRKKRREMSLYYVRVWRRKDPSGGKKKKKK